MAHWLTVLCAVRLWWALLIVVVPAPAQTPATGAPLSESQVEARKAFLNEAIEFDRYVFPPGGFPSVRWKNPSSVEREVGALPLSVEFYDRNFARVTRAQKEGRYAALVQGKTSDGFTVVRYVTLFCCRAELDDYSPNVPIAVVDLPGFSVPSSSWQSYRQNLRRFSFGSLLTFPAHDPDAAILLAGLSELDSTRGRTETPRMHDRRWWLEFKRRFLNAPPPRVPVLHRTTTAAPVLVERQTGFRGGYTDANLERIRTVCSQWADSGGLPVTALVAQDGRVVFHESFGRDANGKRFRTSTPTWMASITKLLTGVLVMQFVDQGILDLDAPLDQYLPELSAYPCRLTLRQCLTHTTGLGWTGEWASDWNPSMENQVAHSLPVIAPGTAYAYHRSGYALAAKVVERVSGRTVPDLFDTMILSPLGMDSSTVDNTYGGLYAPALDLARFGQMLLNRGAYGNIRYLSDTAFASFLPHPVRLAGTDEQKMLGIGVGFLGGFGLGAGTFGHAAASGALLRIDPEHRLVIVLGRDREGDDQGMYRRFTGRFLRAVTAPWGQADE